jgi:hypothetical protein
MESIKVNAGIIRLQINDTDDVLEFNPTDILFAEKYYQIYSEFQSKQQEYLERSAKLDADKDKLDENGVPYNFLQGIELVKEVCGYMSEKIDWLFGAGTCRILFGGAMSIDMISQFFEAITPYIESARNKKVVAYSRKQKNG